jgi:hypothetical protein
MLNGLNEWTTQISKGVNSLNEWGTEKAKAINGIHEWTSSIAKNLNHSVNWSEDMFGRAISKEDLLKVVDYIELVAESKKNPELKLKIEEMLKTHSITNKPLNEASLKGISVLTADNIKKFPLSSSKVDTNHEKNHSVTFNGKTIEAKMKAVKLGKEGLPKGHNDKLQMNLKKEGGKLSKAGFDGGLDNSPNELKAKLKVTKTVAGTTYKVPGMGPKKDSQNMKLNVKTGGKGFANENLNKTSDIQTRKLNLDGKLTKIVEALEKEKSLDENVKSQFPFTQLLSEEDRKRFNSLDATDKQKVASEIAKVPTIDSKVIVKLWDNALEINKVEEPLWLSIAPKPYKEAYNSATELIKENIKARAEFYTLNTQYQVDNFWETSGVISKPVLTLNESVSAKTTEESDQKLDTFVAGVGEYMKNRYNQ